MRDQGSPILRGGVLVGEALAVAMPAGVPAVLDDLAGIGRRHGGPQAREAVCVEVEALKACPLLLFNGGGNGFWSSCGPCHIAVLALYPARRAASVAFRQARYSRTKTACRGVNPRGLVGFLVMAKSALFLGNLGV
jgi:hypothetical protein